jgi:hypothetical protein
MFLNKIIFDAIKDQETELKWNQCQAKVAASHSVSLKI